MPDPLDPELVEGISLAKKKPLSFALIAKGTEPVKLIIQKKVIKEGAIAKAKSTYKGNLVISGVCIGSGAQLEFQVVGEASDEPSIKTKKIKDFPVIFMGTQFWEPFRQFVRQSLLGQLTVDPGDVDRVLFTDSPEIAVEAIRRAAIEKFGLQYGPLRPRRRWWLGEFGVTRPWPAQRRD